MQIEFSISKMTILFLLLLIVKRVFKPKENMLVDLLLGGAHDSVAVVMSEPVLVFLHFPQKIAAVLDELVVVPGVLQVISRSLT